MQQLDHIAHLLRSPGATPCQLFGKAAGHTSKADSQAESDTSSSRAGISTAPSLIKTGYFIGLFHLYISFLFDLVHL